ncbi:hypothetical protein QCA50_015278 [Cerrena zonata]|uniref:DUF221-domain-containing protein n=1 Tax=Cerrena zonata TaxID=2478898 RepID=A0AAW0FLN9_9APHY
MATIQSRPFSKNYSGLVNQSVIAVGIFVVCITSHELMRRKRRGKRYRKSEGLGSVETWEFGYLFQGRSWAKNASPPLPLGWPLAWVKQVLSFPEDRFNELRGVDASVYLRFLKGCWWFSLTHTFTTLPILLPIHVQFSDGSVSPKSMTRASISSLAATEKGMSLLWIHLLLLIWITGSWMFTLYWICQGAFRFRALKIQEAADREASESEQEKLPHPHPQYTFHALPPLSTDHANRGLRMRTVMVTNIPVGLRSEKELKEYFEYYLSRPIAKPSVGVPANTQPGFLNRQFTFLFNRARKVPLKLQRTIVAGRSTDGSDPGHEESKARADVPVIDHVVLVRKMSGLASLLERREEALKLLETAHIKLAKKTLAAVKEAMEEKPRSSFVRAAFGQHSRGSGSTGDVERGTPTNGGANEGEDRMQLLIRTLGPFVPKEDIHLKHRRSFPGFHFWNRRDPDVEMTSPFSSASAASSESGETEDKTVWDALLSLPRSTLDSYQPLIYLSAIFRGKAVPSIDYYTTKLNLLTALITEKRATAVDDYAPMSTAFVTFQNPEDARRACKYLAVHPNNPLDTCLVNMAPSFEDLDWFRLMKSTFRVEFVKDWVVNLGVWAFTIFWVFPVTIFVGLVSIQNISAFWPGLRRYLDKHEWEEELIQSFLPTLLVALLALLIPLILLLIAKKAHTIATLSALHDRIMTRYYKFLIVNVLVFFCVGTAALQSFLLSFKSTASLKVVQVVADSFPTAGPFYVGWPVIKNQLLHVYARNYELNGQFILIRSIRYSLDGLILSQVIFLAYMVILKKTANVAVSAILIVFTAFVKMTLTRICRARFERDDKLEASIVCGTGTSEEQIAPNPTESTDMLQHPEGAPQHPRSWKDTLSAKSEYWTMRLAQKMEFTYGSVQARPARNTRRQPNPFGPLTSGPSTSTSSPVEKPPVSPETSPTIPECSPAAIEASPNDVPPEALHPALVSPHPPHSAWDDESSPDHTYQNPYYTRPISNSLWLPRDPTQLLDLDDTVDIRVSLTSEPGVGKLGTWDEEDQFLETSLSSVLGASFGSVDEDLTYTPQLRPLDGSEIIVLPAGIASRVEHLDQEDEVETTSQRRPSIVGRRTSSTSFRPLGLGRPKTFDSERSQFRSFSLGAEQPSSSTSDGPPSGYVISSDRHRRNRAASMGDALSLRPDMLPPSHNTSRSPSRSLVSIVERSSSLLVPRHAPGPSSIISTRDAVVGEVIAEEQEATQERMRQEEAEEKAQEPRSLFTSWMFARRH